MKRLQKEPSKHKKLMKNSSIMVILLLIVLQIFIYAPNVGKGFIRDDFNWLENSTPDGKVDFIRPFRKTTGFFRPLVSLTFGLQYQLHGLNPKPFGLFNLLLHSFNIVLVYFFLSYWKETRSYALGATILFALNAKAAGMAVGWISGRTTLLVSFFLLLSINSFLHLSKKNPMRFLLTGVCYFAALLSKETAVAAPIYIFFFAFFTCHKGNLNTNLINRIKKGIGASGLFIVPLIFYFLLRFNSDAMTPLNAPDYYRFNFSPLFLLENLIEYILRAALLDIYVIILFLVLVLVYMVKIKNKFKPKESFDFSAVYMGLLWFMSFLLPSMFVPARSSLYSYFPQVMLHVSALAVIFFIWRNRIKPQKGLRNIALILVCLLLLGWGRYLFIKSESNGENGKFSAQFTQQVIGVVSEIPSESKIYVIDKHFKEKLSPSNLISHGFNPMMNLYYPQKHLKGEIVTPIEATRIQDDPFTFFFIWEDSDLSLRPMDF